MIVVLDASAALEIALNRNDGNKFRECLVHSDVILAPDIYPSEITNTFWKYHVFSSLSQEECEKGINYCIELVDDFVDTKNLCCEVLSESIKKKHPAYDFYYLVLARRSNASILSKDKKMNEYANKMEINILK